MAVTGGSRVIRFTADNDVYDSGNKKLKVAGVRLVTAAADSTASVREGDANGVILYSLTALAKTSDESQLPITIDSGKVHVDLSGAGAEVYLYLE